jgi:hypothetical protein
MVRLTALSESSLEGTGRGRRGRKIGEADQTSPRCVVDNWPWCSDALGQAATRANDQLSIAKLATRRRTLVSPILDAIVGVTSRRGRM